MFCVFVNLMGFGRWILGICTFLFFLGFCYTVCCTVRQLVYFPYILGKRPLKFSTLSLSVFSCTLVPREVSVCFSSQDLMPHCWFSCSGTTWDWKLFARLIWEKLNGLIRTFLLKNVKVGRICKLILLESCNIVNIFQILNPWGKRILAFERTSFRRTEILFHDSEGTL